ncbi:LytR/AlgR family response regulator transcription factor [Chryseobacterium balustinum]|uniref:Probable transcriptional regulatory protein YehT n=1 Tax=Chryseobacterium balustinum TaxID=246 RepID=A0AAX2ILP6_9FLAO|nr:response regulator transcription factor [Chryseobacterium balustinum]AZB29764.1 DNA-binding response regulator [Chryseobacterium balustinum]SKC12688.1 two component transcriptional regulator, LytTR family [Chryseobacterium balustinum]SQA90132.1 Probable transcriptional regulatory protein YehT [Chryseobacterium balustinum]
MKIRCLIVDDEKLAQDVLIHHISKFDILQLEGVCSNVFELISFLNKNTGIDLIFLDIKMPEIQGTEFVDMFKNPPAIIYTTAYNQYAVDAFNQDALDYLLKPISLERFSKSVQKATKILSSQQNDIPAQTEQKDNVFYVKSDKRLVKIDPTELIFIEGMGNYVCLHTETNKIMLHSTLSAIEENLNHLNYICRVHKSFFINLNKIKHVEQHVIILNNNKNVPIGLSYRNNIYDKLKII